MYKTQQTIVELPAEETDRADFERFLLTTHGITLFQYEHVYKMQKGRCAVCDSNKSARGRFVVALDAQGLQRGLVCNRCKMGLSFFNNNIALLSAAIKLIEPLNPSI